jgi:hypothetical protein
LVYGFRDLSLWSLTSVASGPMHGETEHRGGEHVVEQSDSPHGGQEAERIGDKVYPPRAPSYLPSSEVLPSFQYFPVMPSNYKTH